MRFVFYSYVHRKGKINMDLNKINYSAGVSKATVKKPEKAEEKTKTEASKEQKETKLPGFAQMGAAISSIVMTTKKVVHFKETIKDAIREEAMQGLVQANHDGSFEILSYDADYMRKVNDFLEKDNLLEKVYTCKNKDGSTPMHCANFEQMQEIHRALKNQPEVLAQIHTTQNNYGHFPIDNSTLEEVKEIHKALESQPEALATIYTTADKNGRLRIHNASLDNIKEIHSALKNQPEVLAQMHTTQDKNGKLPIHGMSLARMHEVHMALKDQPEILAQIHTTEDKNGDLPIHHVSEEKANEIREALKDQPEILAKIDNHEGKV